MQLPYFYEPSITSEIKQFTLNKEASHHAVQVLRIRQGEGLQLTDGKGLLLTAEMAIADSKNSVVKIVAQEFIPQENKNICLAVSPTKNNARLEWLVEKVAEIGVRKIVLLNCLRTENVKVKTDRLHSILVSAMLQSRQVYLPELQDVTVFDEVVLHNNYEEKLIAHCVNDTPKTHIKHFLSDKSKLILIGPEGDFTNKEISLALQHSFRAVTLGNTRLRTETAGIVAVAVLNILAI